MNDRHNMKGQRPHNQHRNNDRGNNNHRSHEDIYDRHQSNANNNNNRDRSFLDRKNNNGENNNNNNRPQRHQFNILSQLNNRTLKMMSTVTYAKQGLIHAEYNITDICTHKNDKGQPALNSIKTKSPISGKAMTKCNICKKEIDLQSADPARMKELEHLSDHAMDMIKLISDYSPETAAVTEAQLKELASWRNYTRIQVVPRYMAALRMSQEKKKKNKNRSSSQSVLVPPRM